MKQRERILDISEAKRVAIIQGLVPIMTDDTVKFVPKTRDEKVINWDDLENFLIERNLEICEISGYMKIVNKEEENEDREYAMTYEFGVFREAKPFKRMT